MLLVQPLDLIWSNSFYVGLFIFLFYFIKFLQHKESWIKVRSSGWTSSIVLIALVGIQLIYLIFFAEEIRCGRNQKLSVSSTIKSVDDSQMHWLNKWGFGAALTKTWTWAQIGKDPMWRRGKPDRPCNSAFGFCQKKLSLVPTDSRVGIIPIQNQIWYFTKYFDSSNQ